jgi:hypothetical protein
MRFPLSLSAYALLALALYASFGNAGEHISAVWLVPVLGALALAMLGARVGADRLRHSRLWLFLLGSVVGLELLALLRLSPVLSQTTILLPRRPLDYFEGVVEQWQRASSPGARFWLPASFAVALLGIALVCLPYSWPAMPGRRLRFPVILSLYIYMGAWIIHTSPEPYIDVWTTQQRACKLLLAGQNPYAGDYPNPYGRPDWFAPQVIWDGRIHAYQYPPLSLLLTLGGYVLGGDVRWSMLAATATAAAFMVAMGRKLGLRAGHPGELAAVALLCHPLSFLMVEMGWNEPFLALGLSVAGWAAAAGKTASLANTLGPLASVKQYGFLIVPPFWKLARAPLRLGLAGLVAAILVVLPFFLWDPNAFWRGVVTFHLYSPMRTDHSLAISAAVALATGYHMPAIVGLVAAVAAAWILVYRRSLSLSQALLAAAAILLSFVVFGKGGHPNYYWLASACLAAGVVAAVGEISGKK